MKQSLLLLPLLLIACSPLVQIDVHEGEVVVNEKSKSHEKKMEKETDVTKETEETEDASEYIEHNEEATEREEAKPVDNRSPLEKLQGIGIPDLIENANYMGAHQWPPSLSIQPANPHSTCSGFLSDRHQNFYHTATPFTYGGVEKGCILTGDEGAAGSTYNSYKVYFVDGESQISMEYVLRSTSCGAMPEVMDSCEAEIREVLALWKPGKNAVDIWKMIK